MSTSIDKVNFVNSLIIKYVDALDIERAFQLESEGYPPEEAATLETLKYRQKVAPKLFLGAYLPSSSSSAPSLSSSSQLIGYVVSTSTLSETLTHESMSLHEEEGKTVCIHSVCVDKRYRRYGVATKLLNEYISLLKKNDEVKYKRCALLAHEYLISLYQNVGFKLIGESEVVHGPEKWFDLVMEFYEL